MSRLRLLQAGGNTFTLAAVRGIAIFLESSGIRGGTIKHVYIRREGEVEAIFESGDSAVVVDMRPATPMGPIAVDHLKAAGRKKKSEPKDTRLREVTDVFHRRHNAFSSFEIISCQSLAGILRGAS